MEDQDKLLKPGINNGVTETKLISSNMALILLSLKLVIKLLLAS